MRLIAPHGFSSMTHAGMSITAKDGMVEVPAEMAETMKAHGFRPWSPDPHVDMLDRTSIENHLVEMYRDHLRTLSIDELRGDLEKALAEHKRRGESKPAEEVDATRVTEADVERMKREEMLSFLKVRGVAVSPQMSNEDLKRVALRTVRGDQPKKN